jgi:uroporphyrinogen-III synthase
MNVVLTREAGWNGVIRGWLPPGMIVEEVPLTTTTYVEPEDVRAAIENFDAVETFRTIVVTSERSARYVDIALAASATDVEVCCVGTASAEALRVRGVTVDVTGEGTAEDLARQISHGPVLLLGAKAQQGELRSSLLAKGLEMLPVACYETIPLNLDKTDVTKVRAARVLFIGAPSAWRVARDFVNPDTWVVVPGATTAAAVVRDHARVIEGWGPELATRLAELLLAG